MRKIISLLVLGGLGTLHSFSQQIYVTETPTTAQVKVYVVNTPTIADLVVYKANSPVYPGVNQNEGIWYFVSTPTIANKTIYYVETPTIADLQIYFTEVPTIAGWRNPNKRQLME